MADKIKIVGAKEHNLKNVSLEIPKNELVVFTGVSGSGKSSLAFDTIFAEGQRRYVESLSPYVRQFLGQMDKPDVDEISGLSPAISIDQKTTSHNPRSTVGTVTEIYDYLRLLYARIGIPYCPTHNEPIIAFSPQKMTDIIMNYPLGTKIQIISPVVRHEKGSQKDVLDKIKGQGFERLRVDSTPTTISEVPALDKNKRHDIDIIVDRVVLKEDSRSRIFDAIELALDWSHGYLIYIANSEEKMLSEHHTCTQCGFSVPKLEPRLFSLNSPLGCCKECNGLGIKREADISILIPDRSLSIKQGAIVIYKNTMGSQNLDWQDFLKLCEVEKIPLDKPIKKLSDKEMHSLLYGTTLPIKYTLTSSSGNVNHRFQIIQGIKTKVERLYNETSSNMMREYYERFMKDRECTACHGARLSPEVLSVRINKLNIYEVTCLSLGKLKLWIPETIKTLNKTEYE